MPVKKGDFVKVNYHGTLDDGEVFDTSDNHDEPLMFEVGCGQVIAGFDDALLGMEPGEEKEIRLECEEAYGEVQPELIQQVSKEHVPEGENIEVGTILALSLPNGQQIPATITKIDEESITIDINHPLAGQALNFKLKLLEITDKPEGSCSAGCSSCHEH